VVVRCRSGVGGAFTGALLHGREAGEGWGPVVVRREGMKIDNEIIAVTFTNRKGFCPLLSAMCPLLISPFPFKFSAVLIFL